MTKRGPKVWCPVRRNQILAHRLAFAEHHGLELEQLHGIHVYRRCGNRRCIEPAHLVCSTPIERLRARRGASGDARISVRVTEAMIRKIRQKGPVNTVVRRALEKRLADQLATGAPVATGPHVLTVVVPADLRDRLEAEARLLGISLSALVREAVTEA